MHFSSLAYVLLVPPISSSLLCSFQCLVESTIFQSPMKHIVAFLSFSFCGWNSVWNFGFQEWAMQNVENYPAFWHKM
jgi:hypothetical protein